MMKNSVLVGLSGGLDSTFAALSLMEDGYAVEGAVLCFSEHTDIRSAEKAASDLGIKLHIIDCRNDFKSFVTENFISEYRRGRTPNPCVVCNRYVKIERLFRAAKELGLNNSRQVITALSVMMTADISYGEHPTSKRTNPICCGDFPRTSLPIF